MSQWWWLCFGALSCGSADMQLPVPIRPAKAYEKVVCISPEFDQEDTQDIIYSITQWNAVANQTNVWITVRDSNCQWAIYRADLHANLDNVCNNRLSLACAELGGPRIWVLRDRINSQYKLRGVILHELGHLLWARHTKSRQGLMTPEYSGYEYRLINQETIDQVILYNQKVNAK